MLPRLQAQDEIRHVNAVAAGNGLLKQADQARYLSELARTAAGNEPEKARPAEPATLAAIGIRVQRVPKKRRKSRRLGG